MDQRIKGQEVSVRAIDGGNVVGELNLISNFDDTVALEIKEAGYLGELVNRFDEILNGYGGSFDANVNKAAWSDFARRIVGRARRETPDVQFNVVRTDLFPNGDSNVFTYRDVAWGNITSNVAGRGDYVKVHFEFKCSDRPDDVNALP